MNDWKEQAVCRDAPLAGFWPEEGTEGRWSEHGWASLCGGCPVQAHCLAYALEDGIREGIYAGMNGPQRSTWLSRVASQLHMGRAAAIELLRATGEMPALRVPQTAEEMARRKRDLRRQARRAREALA